METFVPLRVRRNFPFLDNLINRKERVVISIVGYNQIRVGEIPGRYRYVLTPSVRIFLTISDRRGS